MHPNHKRNGGSEFNTMTPEAGVDCDGENETDTLTKAGDSTGHFNLNWYYYFGTNWILRCLIGNVSRKEEYKTEDASTALSRVDSGIGFNLLGQENRQLSPTAASTPPTPITLIFYFEDGTTTKLLDYRVYSRWTNINPLLHELALDGIVVHDLWDVQENMQIGSGDWDARIQPGSVIEAWCFNGKRNYHSDDFNDSSDCETDDEMVESDGVGDDIESEYRMNWKSTAKNIRNEHTWWFARWRQRVEKTMSGRHEVTNEPPWLFIVVWCTATITIIALLILLNQ